MNQSHESAHLGFFMWGACSCKKESTVVWCGVLRGVTLCGVVAVCVVWEGCGGVLWCGGGGVCCACDGDREKT